jgi:hypothetical protein
MRQYGIKAGTVKWRALLIIGALISLCLSDTVGPRLLPLPVSELVTTASAEGQPGPELAASRTPSPTKGSSPRVEMAVTAHSRAGADHKQVQAAAHNPHSVLEAPADIILDTLNAYQPLYSLAAQVSRPPGRAPPRLV